MAQPSSAPISAVSDAEWRAHELFTGEVCGAMVELAHHYHFDVLAAVEGRRPCELVGHQVAGIIGFAGHGFGGTLAIRAPSAVVRSCLPGTVQARDLHALGDWIAELANQLLGRTKNKLIRSNTSFQITPPTYAMADELLVLGSDAPRTSWIAVETTVGALLVMVELRTAPGFAFELPDAVAAVAHAEGELLLF